MQDTEMEMPRWGAGPSSSWGAVASAQQTPPPPRQTEEEGERGVRDGNGRALAELFRALGYEPREELPVDALDALFGLPSRRIQAFLAWFLGSIRARHSVKRQLASDQDYAIYEALMKRGGNGSGQLLAGEALARAEESCQRDYEQQYGARGGGHTAPHESLERMQADNDATQREIDVMERRLRLADAKNDALAAVVQRRTQEVDRQRRTQQQQQPQPQRSSATTGFGAIIAQLRGASEMRRAASAPSPDALRQEIRNVLSHLSSSSSSTGSDEGDQALAVHAALAVESRIETQQHHRVGLKGNHDRDGNHPVWRQFLYQQSLDELQQVEDCNLLKLKARIPTIAAAGRHHSSASAETAKHVDAGMPRLRGSLDNGDVVMSPRTPLRNTLTTAKTEGASSPSSPWLHDTRAEDLQLREQDALLYNKCCVELARLRHAFVVGQRDALHAELQVTRHEARLHHLTTSRRLVLQQCQLMSVDAIAARHEGLRTTINSMKKQLSQLIHHEFPQQLEQLATLKATGILRHSYEHKLWRQEHRFLKLGHLLEALQAQHARLQLVHRLLDADRQDLLHIDALFHRVIQHLNQHNAETAHRLSYYSALTNNDTAQNTFTHTYLGDHDFLAHELFRVLQDQVQGSRGTQPAVAIDSTAHDNGKSMLTTEPRLGGHLRTFDALARLAETKQTNEATLTDTALQLRGEWMRLLQSKRATLNQLCLALFGDPTSSTPMLLPTALQVAMEDATRSKDEAEGELQSALEPLRVYKRSLAADSTLRMQQERGRARLARDLQQR